MKQCLTCNVNFSSSERAPCACGTNDYILDGFHAYAPSRVAEGEGFKSHCFESLAKREARNFWFRVRNQIILWALKRYSPAFHSFFEIGCGTGFVLSGIAKAYPNALLQGSDLFTEGLHFAAKRLPSAEFMQMDARQIPFVNEFDCIGAFDVLEHIQEDTIVLHQINKALKDQGILLLTVPQHQWLWSRVDDHACHVRRYSANELHSKLEATGFKVLRSTSFLTTLLPAMIISRFTQKKNKKKNKLTDGLSLPFIINFLFERMLNIDARLIRSGINLPLTPVRSFF